MEAFKAKYGYDLARAEGLQAAARHRRVLLPARRRPPRYGIAIYTQTDYDAMAMGFENALFSYGGELGDYATVRGRGHPQLAADRRRRSRPTSELYSFTPPNWGNTFFQENNQAITEGLVAMSMNYFAFFPALVNQAINPHAEGTGYFANPPGPNGEQFAALGGQGISIVSYSDQQEESKKFLEWFIQDDVQKRWAELGGYTATPRC